MFVFRKLLNACWHHPREQIVKLLQLEDSPHSIALGGALGLFVALTPTFGIQVMLMILISIICRPLFRFNLIASFLGVYVTNPLTAPFIYWMNYKVGLLFVGGKIDYEELKFLLTSGRTSQQIIENLWELFQRIGYPLTIGCFIVGILSAVMAYPIILRIVMSAQSASQKLRKLKMRMEQRAVKAKENANLTSVASIGTNPNPDMHSNIQESS